MLFITGFDEKESSNKLHDKEYKKYESENVE
jgi:hypothetical protein